MSGTSGLGLAQGFMQGFDFMERIEDRKTNRKLAEDQNMRAIAQDQRASESHSLNISRAEKQDKRAEESHGITLDNADYAKKERQRVEDGRLVQAMQTGVESGNLDPQIAGEFGKRFNVDWSSYTAPEFGQSIDVLKTTVSGQSQYNLRSPEVISAFNVVYKPEIKKNLGEKIKRDGKEYTIVDKTVTEIVPTGDSKSVMIGLTVTAKDKDGKTIQYKAPVTGPNRDSNDEFVKPVPVDALLQKLQGHDMVYRGIQQTPQLKAMIEQQSARLGVSTKPDYSNRIEINGQLVDKATGKSLGDFRDPETKRGGKNIPADVQTAEWMVAQGIAPDLKVAWNRINESHTDPAKFVMDYVKQETDIQNASFMTPDDEGYKTPETLRNEAIEALKFIREQTRGLNQPEGEPKPKPGLSAVTPAQAGDIDKVITMKTGPNAVSGQIQRGTTIPTPPSAAQTKEAPLAAIQALKDGVEDDPSLKQQFLDYYGYLPEGF